MKYKIEKFELGPHKEYFVVEIINHCWLIIWLIWKKRRDIYWRLAQLNLGSYSGWIISLPKKAWQHSQKQILSHCRKSINSDPPVWLSMVRIAYHCLLNKILLEVCKKPFFGSNINKIVIAFYPCKLINFSISVSNTFSLTYSFHMALMMRVVSTKSFC